MPRLRRSILLFVASLAFLPIAWSQDLPVIRPGATKSSQPQTPVKASDDESQAESDEHWQVILIDDERAGYVRTRTETLPAKGDLPERIRTNTETKMTVKRFGQALSIDMDLVTTENLDGEMLSYEFEMGTSPTSTTKSVGTVSGKNLTVKTTIAGTTHEKTTAWDSTIKSPAYQERVMREEGLKPGETKTFRTFVPELNVTTDISVAADDFRDVKLPNGTTRRLLKTKVTQAILPTAPITAYFDEKGVGVLAESQMLGMKMRYFDVSKAEALQEIAGAELDLAVNTLIPASPLNDPHATKEVTYRIHVPGEDAKSLFVDGGTQRVKVIDRETVEVTVTSKPIPRTGGKVKADAEFTGPTQLLQSNDAKIKEHLRRAAPIAMKVKRRESSKNTSTKSSTRRTFRRRSPRPPRSPTSWKATVLSTPCCWRHYSGREAFRRASRSGSCTCRVRRRWAATCGPKRCSPTDGFRSTPRSVAAASAVRTSRSPNRASRTTHRCPS